MSQSSARSTAFLREMGVGVQWKLRHAPEADGFAEAVQALADGLPAEPVSPAPAEVRSAVPEPVAPRPASPQAAPFEADPRPAAVPVPVPAPPPPQPAAAGEDTAWFDEAPMPPPAATPARPATAMPPSPAAPPRAAATAPSTTANSARPAASVAPQSGGSRPPAPAASRPAPSAPARPASRPAASADPAAADEDTSWFDDAPMPAPAAMPSQPAPAAPVSDAAIAEMDWPALQAAVASCTRCTLCTTRKAAVNGRGAENATWLAVAGVPSEQDEQDAQAITGEAGQLLHNMLKAIELKPEADVYVTNVVKCRPPQRNPTAEEVIACRPFLDRELALTGATRAITFGQFAARGLMMGPAARGQVMRYQQLSVVATYHPDDLLRKPEDKAKAWADLCLAKAGHA